MLGCCRASVDRCKVGPRRFTKTTAFTRTLLSPSPANNIEHRHHHRRRKSPLGNDLCDWRIESAASDPLARLRSRFDVGQFGEGPLMSDSRFEGAKLVVGMAFGVLSKFMSKARLGIVCEVLLIAWKLFSKCGTRKFYVDLLLEEKERMIRWKCWGGYWKTEGFGKVMGYSFLIFLRVIEKIMEIKRLRKISIMSWINLVLQFH